MPTRVAPGVTMVDDGPSVVVPPINFSLVAPGVYRSGHPNRKNFPFLKRLKLKGIIYVEGSDPYRQDSLDFVQSQNLELYRFDFSNESDLYTPEGKERMEALLKVLLDKRNYPLLVHDDTGKGSCTLVCALIRRFQSWSLTGLFAEGDMFAGPAGGAEGVGLGETGMEFIAAFQPKLVNYDRTWRPDWADY
ncbi:cytoplasmic protein [Cryptococcus neoformans c8]|nr:cytoplasmic protein [Cryptococcus neoformans var. grubii AD1-83a]OXG57173.1 cytoplasmic protein [Cryptococcus neoformans var. grubii MW-RSA1955]OXG61922.1 cytoplasmic protein [Cryptococcus neoformans var. grubii CHC193]OXG62305.1 cytoplasmic protein [Cryptococcus neoformans var. grubii c8]OXH09146.1 cytoplasmic protein [Cryptococcus neoformans var. grubii A5-35-17]OXH10354.1 cytoplasmic protein [Cryptococcus neoformans var. grubii A1-35-8]